MRPPSRLRTLVLLCLGLVAVAAWRLASVDTVEAAAATPTRRLPPASASADPARASAGAAPTDLCSTVPALSPRASWSDSGETPDPFRLRAGTRLQPRVVTAPASTAPAMAQAPVPVSETIVATAPPPPSLPYRFLGQLAEPDGSDVRVFLLLDEKLLIARAGDTLEGGWRLGAVQPGSLKFERVGDAHAITLATDGN